MFAKSIKIVSKSMFPIFKKEKISEKEIRIGVAGTGFFINSSGLFVTVAHIFDSANGNTKFLFFGCLPDNLETPPLEISEVVKDDEKDIFIGKINKKGIKALKISRKEQSVGRSVCVSGYPLALITNNNCGGIELGGVRRYFQPSFILDKWNVKANSASGKIRKHEGYLVRDVGLFGMSGGPVFNKKGEVIGMQGSVTAPRTSSNGDRTISVENAMVISSKILIDTLKKSKIKNNFLSSIIKLWQNTSAIPASSGPLAKSEN